jgi:hypothetical protein
MDRQTRHTCNDSLIVIVNINFSAICLLYSITFNLIKREEVVGWITVAKCVLCYTLCYRKTDKQKEWYADI